MNAASATIAAARVDEAIADPFGENPASMPSRRVHILGMLFEFQSNSRELMALVERAYAGLPRHRLAKFASRCRIKLVLQPSGQNRAGVEPPAVTMHSAAGLLYGAMDSSTCVVLSPAERTGLVLVSADMLKWPYHVRYELLEFAVFTLAARILRLVPLHAACIGRGGNGLLLVGPSGAGKSTVATQCLLEGLDFLSEDSVFVEPASMLATGVPNFLHLRKDSLRFIEPASARFAVQRSPVIRRRSGVEKFEVDLRCDNSPLARNPLKLVAAIFVSPERADAQHLLTSLRTSQLLARLKKSQPYAASRPEWKAFCRRVAGIQAFELRRADHPRAAVEVLRGLLA